MKSQNPKSAQVHAFGVEWTHELEEGIMKSLGALSCVEIIAENFFEGRFRGFLTSLQQQVTPTAVHGVLLSIGSAEPLREDHLEKVLEVGEQVNMINYSEHLSMTRVGGIDLDALTPLAWNDDVIDLVCRKIDRIQSRLKVPFLIENVSNRFIVPGARYSETQFINRILELTGCGLLLDVTNVYTNSVNFGFDPYHWIEEINKDAVELVHLAGGFYEPDGFLMDSHDNRISDEAWDLYQFFCKHGKVFTTIIERTGNFPRFSDLVSELDRAKEVVLRSLRNDRGAAEEVPAPLEVFR